MKSFIFVFPFFDDNIELLPVSSSMIQKLILDIIAAYEKFPTKFVNPKRKWSASIYRYLSKVNYQGNKKENVKKNMVVQMLQYSLLRNQLSLKMHLTKMHMELWINKLFCCCCYYCFCGMVDRWKTFSLISSRDHCQRSSPSWIPETLQARFETAQNLISSFVGWSCALVITTTPRSKKHCTEKTLKKRSS